MSDQTKTVLLNVEIDQASALKDLEGAEKSLLDLKAAQSDLNKQYKDGKITQEEFVQSKIKLNQQIKTENDTRNNLIKTIQTESNSINAQKKALGDLIAQRNKTDLS